MSSMASTLAICRISGTLPFAVSTVRPSSPIAGKERCVVMLGIGGLCLMPATWRVLVDNGDDESFSIIICTYHKMMLGCPSSHLLDRSGSTKPKTQSSANRDQNCRGKPSPSPFYNGYKLSARISQLFRTSKPDHIASTIIQQGWQ
ncbi:MAG: hypothetical protein LQ337_004422 [Flavoplaca oasis]|nr:MAG: hypothetical protein LQ337_004422 [Flavoplaca oasis]